jgi:esterase/lipase superfamily enzyme
MGTRLAVRASDRFPGATFCNEVALVCPDVDDGLVGHYMGDATVLKAGQGAPTVRLYMSRKDKMLGLSQRVHGGYERTGKQKELDPKLMKEGQEEDLSAPPTDDEKAEASAAHEEGGGEAATAGGAPATSEKKRLKDAPSTN